MKASYGSFLNGLLTLYCVDLVADIGAELFDVTWTRNSPIAVSVCDDHTKTILSGECGFRFGMDVQGDENNVRAFNFLVSSSFSQIEYWVMNALFPGISVEGSVTYGLGNLLLNNASLEVLLEDGSAVIREVNNNKRLLVIDLSSGRVMDIFNKSIQGAYCYSNQQTEWAYEFGYALLNSTGIFETLVNYFNNVNDTLYYLQDILNGAFESIDKYLNKFNGLINGFVSGFITTSVISLCLVSNHIDSVLLASITLVSLGGLLTHYASDLFKENFKNFDVFGNILSLCSGISLVNSASSDYLILGALEVPSIPALIFLLSAYMVLYPDEVNEAWCDFVYLFNPNYKEYPNIPTTGKWIPNTTTIRHNRQ